ncbi:MAG: hypothetical protein WCO29_13065 [Nostocales cyanobacterium ELA583]|jgi:hypothetical protein
MDIIQQKILEQINFNLQSISLYIEKLSKAEIKLDSNKIDLIDYSNHEWLNMLEYQDLKKRLEEYNEQSTDASMKNNFAEYCRKVCLQIEILVNKFTEKRCGDEKLQDSQYKKLRDFFKTAKENFNQYQDREYKLISYIMEIRNVGSHGDHNGRSILQRIELKGKSIKIKLQKTNNTVSLKEIQNIFSEFVSYYDKYNPKTNNPRITDRTEEGYIVITLSNLKDKYFDCNSIIHYIESNRTTLRHKLGNEFKILPDKHQHPNELKIFFEQQDYAEIKHTMNWFIQEIGKHLK